MAIKTCTGTTSQPFVHVQARLSQPCTITATGLDAPLVTDATGLVGGTYSISLWAASDLTPTGTYYTITEFLGSTDNTFNVQVPASAGPFVLSSILVGTPTASPSPNHVSTLIVDGTSGVAINAAGDIAARSLSVSSSSPYAPNAAAGGISATGLSVLGNTVATLVPTGFDSYTTKGTIPLPALSDSGYPWSTIHNAANANSGLTIVSGRLTNTSVAGSAAGYAQMSIGTQLCRIGADISFSAGAVTGSAALAIWKTDFLLSYPGAIPDSPFHWAISPNQWIFGVWQGNVFTQLANYTFATALTQDGTTSYRFEADIVGSTAYFVNPDGSTASYTDSRIASLAGNYASFEVFQNNSATETRANFSNVWADDREASRRAYATVGDAISAVETNSIKRIWIPVGGLTQWTGQTSATLASSTGNMECWSFASGADNYLQTSLSIPSNWPAIKITYRWANNGAGAGNVSWTYLVSTYTPGATPTGAVDHPTIVAASAQNILVDTVMATALPVLSGSLIELRIERKAASDTLANAVALFGVLIEKAIG